MGSRGWRSQRRRLELGERRPERGATTVVQSVDGSLGLAEPAGDLARREPRHVAEDEHLPLVLGKLRERLLERLGALEAHLLVPVVGRAHLLERDLAAAPDVVEGRIPRHPQYPGAERHLALLVLAYDGHELGEHDLGDVLGVVAISDDALDVALHVVGVAHVEEVHRTRVPLLGAGDGPREETVVIAGPRGRPCEVPNPGFSFEGFDRPIHRAGKVVALCGLQAMQRSARSP
jgi:hypothetical protein